MKVSVAEAARILEERGHLIRRRSDQSARLIPYVAQQLGRELPEDLADFYRERIDSIDGLRAIYPPWNDHVG